MMDAHLPRLRFVSVTFAMWAVLAGPATAQQPEQSPEDIRRALAQARADWAREPTAAETVQAALRYFRVARSDLDGLRRDARLRGLLPTIGADYNYRDDRFASVENQSPAPLAIDQSSDQIVNGVTARVVWDPRDLVFNGDQVNVYGLVGVQRDLMLEVLRSYFARRQLELTVVLRPPEDPIALASLVLRIQEFEAVLDMLTGGWFSEQLAAEAPRRRQRD